MSRPSPLRLVLALVLGAALAACNSNATGLDRECRVDPETAQTGCVYE